MSVLDVITILLMCTAANISSSPVYMRSFVADGNFSADHVKQKCDSDDVWLLDGQGMMTARGPFLEHLRIAEDSTTVRHLLLLQRRRRFGRLC